MKTQTAKAVHCLSCDAKINVIPKARIGQFVYCEVCGTDFEIIQLNPLELDYAYDGEDFEYDDDDDNYEDDNHPSEW